MDLGKLLAPFGEALSPFKDMAVQTFRRALQDRFPGLSLDSLTHGELPVAGSLLESELRRWTGEAADLETLVLTLEPERLCLVLGTHHGWLRHETTLQSAPAGFELTRDARTARFRVLGEPAVRGVNFLGSFLLPLAAPAIRRRLRSAPLRDRLLAESAGAADLQWPELALDLGRVPALTVALDRKLAGFGLLDALAFGPLRIEQGRAVLEFRLAWTATI